MISKSTLEEYARKYQTDERNVLREYLQHLFLSTLYQQDEMDEVYFKGGTALRLIYHSPRFSEDLDFNSSLTSIAPIEQAIIETLSEIGREGITTDIEESKETTGGYLANLYLTVQGQKTLIRIEISFRDRNKRGEVSLINSELFPGYTITQLPTEQIVEGKIQALLSRKKPRDFYDFYFLLRSNMLPTEKGDVMRQALDALNVTQINFDKELKEFLPKSHHPIIRNFKKTLEDEIGRYI